MVVIKEVSARSVLDSRNESTILVTLKTNAGSFSASAPNGKSRGYYEAEPYKKNLSGDIETIKKFSDYFLEESFEGFRDLKKIEDVTEGFIGANTLFALESALLKAIAHERKKEIWQLINPNAKKFPRLVGNCVGGGKHSTSGKKPDFQEFLLVPKSKSVKESQKENKIAKEETKIFLGKKDENFEGKKNDEDAWETSLNEKEIFNILKNLKIPFGIDVAASSFYGRKTYKYKNSPIKRTNEEQFSYICNIIENNNLFYIEDPFHEDDFESFSKLLKKFSDRLIVGDDLTVTNPVRLKKAIKTKSINAIIVKPNQCGSLLTVSEICEIAKKNNIKIVFSHRSGETEEAILADLAFSFQADFFKCGITGKEREAKINRLIEIEENLR
ncbi:MAG TPA: hypothetical protein VJZ93_01550 [Candidatus Nanoarchaeia archaeon]|nr:hypothetical protein [Candidatus Nanoarchaeia archaeon]